jgi:hypothetical protein
MKRLTWVVGPPAAGKSTWAAGLLAGPQPPRVLELADMLHPLVDPSRPRKGMLQAKGLLMQAIRRVELDPDNGGLPPLVVLTALVVEEQLFPLSADEQVLLLLPPREQWERQFLGRAHGHAPGSRPMSLQEAREWYERYLAWGDKGLPYSPLHVPPHTEL